MTVVDFEYAKQRRQEKLDRASAHLNNTLFETSRDSSDDLTAFHAFKDLAGDDWTVYTPSSVPFLVFDNEQAAREFARSVNKLVAMDKAWPYSNGTPPKSFA